MVRWYSPRHLVRTGWRSVVSELFGQYADQRIMQATIDGFTPEVMQMVIDRYDYSDLRHLGDGDTVWVDYIADLGDGFDSTYAMASLVSAPSLEVKGAGKLPGAKLLVMGGDQVYPYPSRQAYRERFAFPYQAALPALSDGSWRRMLFVLPGNHDWYDGLGAFDHMFCKARFGHADENRIGGWLCPQHRSYFAIRLPHNWWIWGADIQLAQFLDAGQVLYFKGVAEAMKQHPTEVPKLIICTAEPSWCKDAPEALEGEDNLSHITRIATDAGARICAVVAGDLHHYSRYISKETGTNFVTAGGGGAYLAPTHDIHSQRSMNWLGSDTTLSHRCKIKDGKSTRAPACWPSRGTSRRLTLAALAFPFRNIGFAAALGVFYWLITWLFGTTRLDDSPWNYARVSDILTKENSDFLWIPDVFLIAPMAAANNFNLGIMSLILAIVLFTYADGRFGRRVKLLLGGLHWTAHVTMMIALYSVVSQTSTITINWLWPMAAPALEFIDINTTPTVKEVLRSILIFPIEMIALGGLAAGLIWGFYLTIFALVGLHSDQAFASMGIADFKNFLRLKVEPSKLTIYPIGLRRTPRRHSWRYAKKDQGGLSPDGPQVVPARPMRPVLIEGPIEIHVGEVKRPEPPGRAPEIV